MQKNRWAIAAALCLSVAGGSLGARAMVPIIDPAQLVAVLLAEAKEYAVLKEAKDQKDFNKEILEFKNGGGGGSCKLNKFVDEAMDAPDRYEQVLESAGLKALGIQSSDPLGYIAKKGQIKEKLILPADPEQYAQLTAQKIKEINDAQEQNLTDVSSEGLAKSLKMQTDISSAMARIEEYEQLLGKPTIESEAVIMLANISLENAASQNNLAAVMSAILKNASSAQMQVFE